MLLVKHLYGINSNRSLIDEVRYNICYRWFCGFSPSDEIPHHASLSNIKKRFPVSLFEDIFIAILEQCRGKGLLESNSCMTDSTLLDANAALNSLVLIDKPSENTEAKEERHTKKVKLSNKTHKSTTDPDATLAVKSRTIHSLKYKVHVCSDSSSRVITAIKITTGSVHDSVPYLELLEYLRDKIKIPVSEVIADRAYGTGAILSDLVEQGISSFIPLFNSRSGTADSLANEFLHYDNEKDLYTCPEGINLVPYVKFDGDRKQYRSKASDCKSCLKSKECPLRLKGKGAARKLYRNHYFELYEKIKADMKTEVFKAKKYERLWKIEGIMNELKNLHGLKRANSRGLDNVQKQSFLAAIAINIKRIIFYIFKLRVRKPRTLIFICSSFTTARNSFGTGYFDFNIFNSASSAAILISAWCRCSLSFSSITRMACISSVARCSLSLATASCFSLLLIDARYPSRSSEARTSSCSISSFRLAMV